MAAVLSVALLVVAGFYSVFLKRTNDQLASSTAVAGAGSAGVVAVAPTGDQNILLVGSDARTDAQGHALTPEQLHAVSTTADGGSTNTDTVIVLHIPAGGGKATAVSIPRDTFIPQSIASEVKGPYDDGTEGTYKPNKINSFYGTAKYFLEGALAKKGIGESAAREVQTNEAGRTMLIKIVQAFTGLKIDHYAEVNLIGFYTLSNAIGGVPVCLNAKVDDDYSGAHFQAGPQTVAGSAAMAFVRQRHGLPGGDLDRVRRQQAFLAGATSKMLSAGVLANPARLTQLGDAAAKSLTLDQGFQLTTFAGQMAGLSGGNVTFTTIPTHGAETATDTDALHVDTGEIRRFFAAIAGTPTASSAASRTGPPSTTAPSTVDPAAVTVDVLDATDAHASGTPTLDQLARAGFLRGSNTDYPGGARSRTTIGYPAGGEAAARAVAKVLGGGSVVADSAAPKGGVRVILGQDMAVSGLRGPGIALVAPAAGVAAADAPGLGPDPAAAGTTGPTTHPTSGPTKAGSVITAGGVQCVN